jgi:hypothetical protein
MVIYNCKKNIILLPSSAPGDTAEVTLTNVAREIAGKLK